MTSQTSSQADSHIVAVAISAEAINYRVNFNQLRERHYIGTFQVSEWFVMIMIPFWIH